MLKYTAQRVLLMLLTLLIITGIDVYKRQGIASDRITGIILTNIDHEK